MRLTIVPVTPAPPPRPLATQSAALIERRALIIRLSILHRNCSCGGKAEPSRRKTYSWTPFSNRTLMICSRRPFDFLSSTQRRYKNVAPAAPKATKSRQHCNPSRTNVQPATRAAPEKFALPVRSIVLASARENKFGKSGRRLLRLMMKKIEMKSVEFWL